MATEHWKEYLINPLTDLDNLYIVLMRHLAQYVYATTVLWCLDASFSGACFQGVLTDQRQVWVQVQILRRSQLDQAVDAPGLGKQCFPYGVQHTMSGTV